MRDEYSGTKSFLLGALIGGAVGATIALLFAPKSGRELRRDIVDTSNDIYDKATDYAESTIEDGKQKARDIVDGVKRQANKILNNASGYYEDAKGAVTASTKEVEDRFESLKEAAKAGADAFKSDLQKGK